ncbi:MAG: carbohydrate ABC transporter permease [Actinobacteria bacterium]|nr:carbohydrate ABC transporter permease [Actinomycetota bacterium]
MVGRTKKNIIKGFIYLILSVVSIISLFPIVLMILGSFKTEIDVFSMDHIWVFKPSMEHYTDLFVAKNFLNNLKNSLILTVSSTILSIIIGLPAAYAFARYRMKRKKDIMFWILSQRMLPPVAVVIPFFLIVRFLGLLDTYIAIIFLYTLFNLPLAIWLLRGFLEEVPVEIEESSRIDGCSEFGILWRIIIPCASGGIVATGIVCMIFTWNEFLFALVLSSKNVVTAPIVAGALKLAWGYGWGQALAAGSTVILPIVVITMFLGRRLQRGLTFGAVK